MTAIMGSRTESYSVPYWALSMSFDQQVPLA
jgi:hypothetical protein